MKRQYSPRHRTLHAGSLAAYGAAGAIVLAFVLRMFFPTGFFFLASPLFALGNYVSSYGEDEAAREREILALTLENEALKGKLLEYGFETPDSGAGTVVPVLARPPVSPYDTLVLAKGSEAGLEKGAYVLSGGVLVGTLEEVGHGYAKAALFSLSKLESEAWVGEQRHPITLVGEGGGSFSARVPKDMSVQEGDAVYVPGPTILPIGNVKKIESDTTSPSATLRIQPAINILTLTEVRIVPSSFAPSL